MKNDREYWIELLEKLNTCDNLHFSLGEVLEELCAFFGFGAGFIYRADYRGTLYLVGSHSIYNVHLPPMIKPENELGPECLELLFKQKKLSFTGDDKKDHLCEKFGDIFGAKSMVLVPIVIPQNKLIALVGIIDRRGGSRRPDADMDFTTAVLATLATYYKAQLFQQRVENTQKFLETTLDNMGVDVYVNDFETHEILYVNNSMAAPYGGKEKLMGKTCWQVLYNDKTQECSFCPKGKLLGANEQPDKEYRWDYQRPFDGAWFRVINSAVPWVDGRLAHIVSSVDITENKRNEEIVRKMAEYDYVTGLPNRAKLTKDFDAKLPQLLRQGKELFVLFLDLDGFKQVNDAMGHGAGDELLEKVGKFLQNSHFTKDKSYRYGGDEFVILLDFAVLAEVMEVISYLLQGFSDKWQLEEGLVRCGASIGVSHYPKDAQLSSHLLRQADQAMYESKRKIKGSVHFYNKGRHCSLKEYLKIVDNGKER